METSLTAENVGGFEASGLMESYCIFSFIYLANICSGPGTASVAVNKTFPQQSTTHTCVRTHTHAHTKKVHLFGMSTAVFFTLLAILYQF